MSFWSKDYICPINGWIMTKSTIHPSIHLYGFDHALAYIVVVCSIRFQIARVLKPTLLPFLMYLQALESTGPTKFICPRIRGNHARAVLHTWPRAVRQNDLEFIMVMVNSMNTMTKRIPHHFSKHVGHGT